MTDLADKIERLSAELRGSVGSISAYIDAITALNRELQSNIPELLSALRAQQHAEALADALDRIVAKDPQWQKDERLARSMAGIARAALAAYRSVK